MILHASSWDQDHQVLPCVWRAAGDGGYVTDLLLFTFFLPHANLPLQRAGVTVLPLPVQSRSGAAL